MDLRHLTRLMPENYAKNLIRSTRIGGTCLPPGNYDVKYFLCLNVQNKLKDIHINLKNLCEAFSPWCKKRGEGGKRLPVLRAISYSMFLKARVSTKLGLNIELLD